MEQVRRAIVLLARSDRPVLVTGPTGSGKELAVCAIHACSKRRHEPFLELNCSALPASLIESELFGHERGAFTGAEKRSAGFFEAVGRGTLFLDEIGEFPLELQAKLLRVLETGTYRRVGSTSTIHSEARVVAATHVDLEKRVSSGQFRDDLLYRLNVLELRMPSLAERPEDIPLLIQHFALQQNVSLAFSPAAIARLVSAPWPGNVRQLRNVVDRLAVFAPGGYVDLHAVESIAFRRRTANVVGDLVRHVLHDDCEQDKVALVVRMLIDEALRLSDGNRTAAARMLGVHRKVVERKLQAARRGGRGVMTRDQTAQSDPRAP